MFVENINMSLLINVGIVFPLFIIISYLALSFPLRFKEKTVDEIAQILVLIVMALMVIGLVLTLFNSDFASGIGIELIGASITGIAIFAIEQRFSRIIEKNNLPSAQKKMRQSIRKVRASKTHLSTRKRNK